MAAVLGSDAGDRLHLTAISHSALACTKDLQDEREATPTQQSAVCYLYITAKTARSTAVPVHLQHPEAFTNADISSKFLIAVGTADSWQY